MISRRICRMLCSQGFWTLKMTDLVHSLMMLHENEMISFLFSCWKPLMSSALMSSSSLRMGRLRARVSWPKNWPRVFRYCLI